jgi:hypothetical protein
MDAKLLAIIKEMATDGRLRVGVRTSSQVFTALAFEISDDRKGGLRITVNSGDFLNPPFRPPESEIPIPGDCKK